MDFIGKDQEQEEIKEKNLMKWIIISVVVLLVVSIILFITISYLKAQLFKFYVDGAKVNVPSSDTFVYQGDKVYVSIKDIAPLINYKYYNGGYKEYTEDADKCYVESANEVCTFEEKSDIIYKTPVNTLNYEYFSISEDIKKVGDKLYILSDDLELACNLKFFYEPEKNMITINTVNYYADYYTKNNKYSSVSTNFNNKKAIMYGLLVTQSVENTQRLEGKVVYYGVSSLDNKEIVGTKYTNIEFIESTQEFIVKTTEGKVGIITADGDTKVQPQYDNLKQIDKDLNLYLVTVGNKYGVVEKYGKTLIYPEYDQIGIDANLFKGNNIKNSYLLFNNTIPVKQNGKWGMYDKKGNLIVPIMYDGIGSSTNSNSSNSIVIIPNIRMIVVSTKYKIDNNQTITLYGLVSWLGGNPVIPTCLSTVYSTVNNGRTEYYMVDYNNPKETINIIEWMGERPELLEMNTENNNKTNSTTNEVSTNTVTNATSNTISSTETNTVNNIKTSTTTNSITNEITANAAVNEMTNTQI